jgi:hypothetical protein
VKSCWKKTSNIVLFGGGSELPWEYALIPDHVSNISTTEWAIVHAVGSTRYEAYDGSRVRPGQVKPITASINSEVVLQSIADAIIDIVLFTGEILPQINNSDGKGSTLGGGNGDIVTVVPKTTPSAEFLSRVCMASSSLSCISLLQ